MTDEKPRETLRMPLKNFRFIGDLTLDDLRWWHSFGLALKRAARDFDRGRG